MKRNAVLFAIALSAGLVACANASDRRFAPGKAVDDSTEIIVTDSAALASERALSTTSLATGLIAQAEVKKEKNVFQKGEEAVVKAAEKTADKSEKVYDKSKKAVVKTAEKTADKSEKVYDKSKEKVKEGWEKLTGK